LNFRMTDEDNRIQIWFHAFDSLNSGHISFHELLRILRLSSISLSEEKIASITLACFDSPTLFTKQAVQRIFCECKHHESYIDRKELVDVLLSVLGCRPQSKRKDERLITITDFQRLNKLMTRGELSKEELDSIFQGKGVLEVDDLAFQLLELL
jgi:hypothetical protein